MDAPMLIHLGFGVLFFLAYLFVKSVFIEKGDARSIAITFATGAGVLILLLVGVCL